MYEQDGPFTLEQLCAIAKFCNIFCFRVIWNSYIGWCIFFMHSHLSISVNPFCDLSRISNNE